MFGTRKATVTLRIATTITIALLSSSTTAQNSINCTRTCGIGNSVDYPFGFSPDCPIQLNCINSTGEIKINQFQVLNITPSSIFINLPTKCNRSMSSIKPLFGSNYSPTRTNGLILHNCKSKLEGCFGNTWFLESRFGKCTGNHKGDNVSCFNFKPRSGESHLIGYEDLNTTSCEYILSSIAAFDGNSLRSEAVELAWWLNGTSHKICSSNAGIEYVALTDGRKGIRCRCTDGFKGDGFINGTKCYRGSGSSTSLWSLIPILGVAIVGGFLAGAFLIGGVAVICYSVRRHSACVRSLTSVKRLVSEVAGSTSITLYRYKDIERATHGFSERQGLGNGAYGTVYAGRLHGDHLVAIKRIRRRGADCIDQVMNEIKLISTVSHPNLVRLLGCCIEHGEQILVYEYMPNGTLSQHLMRERGRGLPWTVRLRIAAETASAIAYLHSEMDPPIFHRDIKSNNILLDFEYKSKVADFGLSRLGMTEADHSHISTAPQGTPGYLDPQYHQQFHLSDKSDVYSFGVVLVEIITALKVVDFGRAHDEVNLAALALDRIGRGHIDEIIDPTIDPHQDAWTLSSVHKVAELAFRCLAYHQDMRPSMAEVAEELEQTRLSGWAQSEENITRMGSSVASSPRSSLYGGSSKSVRGGFAANQGRWSRGLPTIQYYRRPEYSQSCNAGRKDDSNSAITTRDSWLSSRSSPSASGLLSNMVP